MFEFYLSIYLIVVFFGLWFISLLSLSVYGNSLKYCGYGRRVQSSANFIYRACSSTRSYSTHIHNHISSDAEQNKEQVSLNPWYVTGFCDAELCFHIQVVESSSYRLGWKVNTQFSLHVHKKDLALIYKIQAFFGEDSILPTGSFSIGTDAVSFKVVSNSDLVHKILPHFDKYPLLTQKRYDYILFKEAVELINKKEHLTEKGLKRIFELKADMNKNSLSFTPLFFFYFFFFFSKKNKG